MNRRGVEGVVCAVALGLLLGSLPMTMIVFGLGWSIAEGGRGRRS